MLNKEMLISSPLIFLMCVCACVCVRTRACLPLGGYGSTSVHACMWQAIG